MRKFSLAGVSVGLAVAVAALGYSNHTKAQSEGMGQSSPYNPESWVAPQYPGRPLPPGAEAYKDIDGHHLHTYVKDLVDISRRYRDAGHPQYWGRITGTSGANEAGQWLATKYQQIGLTDVRRQMIANPIPQWAPKSWEVSLVSGAETIKLTSAQPPYGAVSTHGKVLDLPIVYVGLGSEADYKDRDVRGKAVLFIRGDVLETDSIAGLSYSIGPRDVVKRAMDRGAAAIFGADLRGGNFPAVAYQFASKVPVFNLGRKDALAIRDAAAKDSPPHVKVSLDATWESGRKSYMIWGTLPGATDETIYIIAHHDGWFDAAGDNASGVAVQLGLAEHFAKIPQAQRRRTIVFFSPDGHHNEPLGDFGESWVFENRDKLFAKTALLINSEHPAEAISHTGMVGRTDAVEPMWWYAGGPSRPKLTQIALNAWHDFGVPLWIEPTCPIEGGQDYVRAITADDSRAGTVSYPCRGISGDMHPFWRDVPSVIAQASNFSYMHTTADSPEIVPWSGLEAATQAYAKMIDEVNKLPLSEFSRPPEKPEYVPGMYAYAPKCAAWIKDSSVTCLPVTEQCAVFAKHFPSETCAPVAKQD
jgi:hypothetical protein